MSSFGTRNISRSHPIRTPRAGTNKCVPENEICPTARRRRRAFAIELGFIEAFGSLDSFQKRTLHHGGAAQRYKSRGHGGATYIYCIQSICKHRKQRNWPPLPQSKRKFIRKSWKLWEANLVAERTSDCAARRKTKRFTKGSSDNFRSRWSTFDLSIFCRIATRRKANLFATRPHSGVSSRPTRSSNHGWPTVCVSSWPSHKRQSCTRRFDCAWRHATEVGLWYHHRQASRARTSVPSSWRRLQEESSRAGKLWRGVKRFPPSDSFVCAELRHADGARALEGNVPAVKPTRVHRARGTGSVSFQLMPWHLRRIELLCELESACFFGCESGRTIVETLGLVKQVSWLDHGRKVLLDSFKAHSTKSGERIVSALTPLASLSGHDAISSRYRRRPDAQVLSATRRARTGPSCAPSLLHLRIAVWFLRELNLRKVVSGT